MMNRAEAAEYIKERCFTAYPNTDDSLWDKAMVTAIRALEQSEQRWIPVTEQLPNDGDDVLITFCGDKETRIVPVNYYQQIWYDCIFDVELATKRVTAWMPLPEPYAERENDV